MPIGKDDSNTNFATSHCVEIRDFRIWKPGEAEMRAIERGNNFNFETIQQIDDRLCLNRLIALENRHKMDGFKIEIPHEFSYHRLYEIRKEAFEKLSLCKDKPCDRGFDKCPHAHNFSQPVIPAFVSRSDICLLKFYAGIAAVDNCAQDATACKGCKHGPACDAEDGPCRKHLEKLEFYKSIKDIAELVVCNQQISEAK